MQQVIAFLEAARSAQHRRRSDPASRRGTFLTSCHLDASPADFAADGSLRPRSFSRLLTFEAQRLLQALGAETRVFNLESLPLPDGHPEDTPKVKELRDRAAWSEGIWYGPRPNVTAR